LAGLSTIISVAEALPYIVRIKAAATMMRQLWERG